MKYLLGLADFRSGSLVSILTCQRHVRLDRNLGHGWQRTISGPNLFAMPKEFRAGMAVDKGWIVRHASGTYVKFTPAGAELFA
jgi:hypothetical protein